MYELIIDSSPTTGVSIALLKDRRMVEYQQVRGDMQHTVGDIYLGVVRKIMPGHNAAFVEVGHEKEGFLHYLDLGPQLRSSMKYCDLVRKGSAPGSNITHFKTEPDIEKTGKITQVLAKSKQLLVQVTKEPISTKGPRLSSELSLPGTYMVLVPFSNAVSVSKKIKTQEERTRLKKLAESIRPHNFGVIIRTVAEEKSVAELHKDLLDLEAKWQLMYDKVRLADGPIKVHGESGRTISTIRDLISEDFSQIVTNDQLLLDEIQSYLKTLGLGKEKIAKLHTGKIPVFEQYEIDKKIKAAFGKNVPTTGGSYLVIEHTEAMHVIDVNSGSKSNSDANQEENALNVNMEAASEIARQLRLRDMGGLIVCDFIDLRKPENRRKVYEKLKEEMSTDRAKHTILPFSKFGLMEITRQRVRPEVNVVVNEVCPQCEGTGEVRPNMLLLDNIEKNIQHFAKELNMKTITLILHPFVAAYLTKGFWSSMRRQWKRKHGIKVTVEDDRTFHMGQCVFMNSMGEEMAV